jgi:hypothetical protein
MLSLDIRAHRQACSLEGMRRMVPAALMLVAMVRRSMLKKGGTSQSIDYREN